MASELQGCGSLAGVRIGKLVRAAHVPQGDFYRCFTGKRECFAVLYESRLDALVAELVPRSDPATTLADLGRRLDADHERLELLILGASELPPRDARDLLGSRQGALAEALADLLAACEGIDPDDPATTLIAGSLVELILPHAYAGMAAGEGTRSEPEAIAA